MEQQERDFVVFTDEDGVEFELDVLEYFEYEGSEYAIMAELPQAGEEVDEEEELEVYIMKVEVNGDYEEFVPPEEDKMEALSAIAESLLAVDEEAEGCGCGEGECSCGEGECDCEGGGCGCGCHGGKDEA